jgi:hypothetical protein
MILAALPPDLYWYVTLVVMSLAVVLGIRWATRVWREARGEGDDDRGTTEDLLTPLVQAYQAGELSEEEYRRIRATLASGPAAGLPPLRSNTVDRPPGREVRSMPPEGEPPTGLADQGPGSTH